MATIKHPARHYIYYLLSQRAHDAKTVISMLADMGLPVPRETWDGNFEELVLSILRTRGVMTFPPTFRPRDKTLNPETLRWLRKWGIHDIWRKHPSVKAAIEILSEPTVRHLLELLLLGPMQASAIAQRLRVRFALPHESMNAMVVKSYSHYFWDPNSMDPEQWKNFLDHYYASGTRSDYVAALQAPRSAAGAAFVIAVADRDPQSLTPVERYEAVSNVAFSMLMHHALSDRNATGHTYAAFTALNMMRMADEELAKHRGGSSDLIAELARMKTVYDQQPPLQITEASYIQRPILDVPSEEVPDANKP